MRSFGSMVDMARTPAEKAADAPMGLVTPCVSDLPDYDYGLCGSFNKESLDKLDLDSDVHVGDFLDIRSLAKVTGVHMKAGSNEIDRVDYCMCNIAVEDEDNQGSEDGDQ